VAVSQLLRTSNLKINGFLYIFLGTFLRLYLTFATHELKDKDEKTKNVKVQNFQRTKQQIPKTFKILRRRYS